MTRTNLATLGRERVNTLLAELGEPKFRSKQLLEWIWKRGVFDPAQMTNLSQKLRERLVENCEIAVPKIVHSQQSSDGTIKYLLQLQDGKTIETVWIPREDQGRVTVCISTQVGCKMGCTFCLTAQQRVERNLTAGEIAGQLLVLPNREKITNVVVMGMGEPFDNYDELMAALDIMTDPHLLEIGPARITVSTSGLVPAIKKFVKESKCHLAISLNAPNDEIRSQIMPINRAYNLEKLIGTMREIASDDYPRARKNKFSITFEYILMKGLNDQPEHARQIVKLLKGVPCKINLLLYNETPNTPFKRPEEKDIAEFRQILGRHGLLNFIRASRGRDISAACGQLASEQKRKDLAESQAAAN
ncbi:MAG TPA: 23S rRNA (adenine(2503)-C(2))-methyltransferase RlmN [Bdellovibrionota bacterium]|jgi:23S rRNA (adenine2503-C2)-methyltransferase|nr:23S rRNA (adenine(2503)-C(2))-methyltransferase RlmN [Bdellovibrionota bacterium]